MALNNFTEQELNLPFSLSYAEYCKIAEKQQLMKAKRQATRTERARQTLTTRQKLIGWTQLGGIVKYQAVSYTTVDGQGVLFVNNKACIVGATFGDFVDYCRRLYKVDTVVKVQVLKP